MKSTLTIILILASLICFSQSSYKIADTSKVWNTVFYGFGSWNIVDCAGTRTNKLADESIYMNTFYFNVLESLDSLQQNWSQVGILREDSLSRKVYFSEGNPEEEGLIYDFELAISDSVFIDNYYLGFEDVILICEAIDSVLINDAYRKRFFFTAGSGKFIIETWIEGIGSNFGIINSGFGAAMVGGGASDLLCCYKSDTPLFINPTFNSCYISDFYPKIVSDHYDTAYLDMNYEFSLEISDTNNVNSFEFIGELIPEDFYFDESTFTVSGIPTSIGSFPCIIRVLNNDIGFYTDMLYSDINVILPSEIDNKNKNFSINIFPNPAEDYIEITNEEYGSIEEIAIYNILGKKLFTTYETNGPVDISNLFSGSYIIGVSLKNTIFMMKLIVR